MSAKELSNSSVIPDALIEKVRKRLSEGKHVRRNLPCNGQLHIDHAWPFLIVYRRPLKRNDRGTENLIKGETSYLIASSSPKMKPSLAKLVRAVVETLTKENELFLIIEVWSSSNNLAENEGEQSLLEPGFRIFSGKSQPLSRTAEVLRKSLKKISVNNCYPLVDVVYRNKRYPDKLPPLVTQGIADKINLCVIGLEIRPIYFNRACGDIYPLVLRALHRALSRAVKQAVFEFVRSQTQLRPVHYLALGKRRLTKAVLEVDSQLARIGNSFDFLLQVSPTNTESAWERFRRSRFERVPTLEYRPLPIDPSLVKRELYQINMDRIEDPTLLSLFHEKRFEIDRELTMLLDQETPNFLYGSLQLFGGVKSEQVDLAKEILKKFSPYSRDESSRACINAVEFAKRAHGEIEYYQQLYPEFSSTVQIRNDISGLLVSHGNLLVGSKVSIPISRVEALLQHEIGTHALTYCNGKAQPFKQLYTGLAGYEETQEGLSVIAEYMVGGLTRPRLRLLAGRVIATDCLIRGASFVETFRELERTFNFNQYTAFSITTRVFRSGGLTKDAIYLRGLTNMLKYINSGYNLDTLFYGKISLSHIPLIQELLHRKILKPSPVFPKYQEHPRYIERLKRLRDGATILDLVERRKQ